MQTLAIVGTGISGMSAGYFLRDKFDITFYEKENYAGGHTNTLTIKENGRDIHIDSAFMVYNESTYPLLTRLFKELKIETKPTSMSFSVQHRPSGLEYCGTGLNGLFAQRRNIFRPRYIKMFLEIDRFRREADEVLDDPYYASWTLAQYIRMKGYSEDFLQKFLVPMSSAVWSTPADTMLEFPVQSLVRFFKNHCFLSLEGQLQWRTCVGGSRQYRDKIIAAFGDRVWTDRAAVKIKREAGKVCITDSKAKVLIYDKVIIACHANEALSLLADPTDLETSLLGKFPYQVNKATLHTDDDILPKLKSVWSSWNNRIENDSAGRPVTSTIYWMNSLQDVSKEKNYFISINDPGLIDPVKILWEKEYAHPLYTVEGQDAQLRLQELNKNGTVFFSGAYFRYGFHEDGLMSGLDAARAVAGGEVWP
jgi:predicted NAD/FAD-binding protein